MESTFINPHNELSAPKRNLPRDVFLHLFAMVALYWSAISFIALCWQYVNYFFPDALNNYYYGGFSGPIRFAIASLIIIFPLFMLVSWLLQRIYTQESVVRESKIRKWLIYLTLFVASLVIIGDLVFVINTFLNGEITARFVLKALSVLAVAAVVFWYYLDDVRRSASSPSAKYFAIITSIVVAAAVIGAFFIVGSPMAARKAQFDQQRVSDLQGIQWQIVNYWQRKGELPKMLTDLNDSISGYAVPTDPETQQPYEYIAQRIAIPSFQLCATFNLASNEKEPRAAVPYGDISQNWNHSAGRHCFNRTIDQQLYPPLNKGK